MSVKPVLVSVAAGAALLGGTIVTMAAWPETSQAQSQSAKAVVDQAIASGVVGETAAGYLALVNDSASPNVVNAMNEINIRRKSVYTNLARQRNVSVDVVAALTGEKQVAQSPSGSMVMNKQGTWVKVP